MADPTPAELEALAAYIGTPAADARLPGVLGGARALLDQTYTSTVLDTIPAPLLAEIELEVAANLYHRREASPAGSYDAAGTPQAPPPRDPLATVRPILIRYTTLPFA